VGSALPGSPMFLIILCPELGFTALGQDIALMDTILHLLAFPLKLRFSVFRACLTFLHVFMRLAHQREMSGFRRLDEVIET